MARPKARVYPLRLTDEEAVELRGCVKGDLYVLELDRDEYRRWTRDRDAAVAERNRELVRECTVGLRRLGKVRRQLEAQMTQARVGMD